MYRLIVPKKSIGDAAVTGFYMNIIKEACELAGGECNVSDMNFEGDKVNDIIIVDDVFKAFTIIRRGYKKIFFWAQGIVPEESYMRNKSKLRFIILSKLEKFVLKRSCFLFLCSKKMKDHYEKKYNMVLDKKSFIMPCFNEEKINENAFINEKKYDYNNFLYVGSIKEWQCFKETVQIYKKIEENSKKDVKLSVFTGQQEEAEEIIKSVGIKKYSISYAKPDELNGKIKDMKYGFVIRKNIAVNNVATPTKFSNYISNGIIPIYSSCINDFYTQDCQYRFGIVYDLEDEENGIKRILENMENKNSCIDMKESCEKWFNNYYNKKYYVKSIAERIKRDSI